MLPLSLIVAVSRNGVIGRDGALPWRLPEDLKFFKRTTLGHAVIMGRKTYESIGRPLPSRRNVVISRDPQTRIRIAMAFPDVQMASSLSKAIEVARQYDSEPFVIGGAQVYADAIGLATRMYLTEVHQDVHGDVRFEYEANEWNEVERVDNEEFSWVTLERKR